MIYVSLTTVPIRLIQWKWFKINLDSLVNQETNKEYYVILNIPYVYVMKDNEPYVIPDELLEYQKNHPKLIINRDTPDYGPILKIVGGLKYAVDPDDILIALDDDEVYHKEMLEYNVKKINEHPDCVICYRGDVSLDKRDYIDNDGIHKYKYSPSHINFPANRDNYLLMPGHSHSACYKRSFFKEDFNEELWKQADGDDPLIGYYARIHEVPILCVKWDKEIDFRLVHVERTIYSFPVIGSLPYNETDGGYLIRSKFEELNGYTEIHGKMSTIISKGLYETWGKIYTEKKQ